MRDFINQHNTVIVCDSPDGVYAFNDYQAFYQKILAPDGYRVTAVQLFHHNRLEDSKMFLRKGDVIIGSPEEIINGYLFYDQAFCDLYIHTNIPDWYNTDLEGNTRSVILKCKIVHLY